MRYNAKAEKMRIIFRFKQTVSRAAARQDRHVQGGEGMAVKGGMQYKTKNRDALIAYLQTREGEHVTVNEIHDHFRAVGSSMGVATIYRNLEKMVADGQMRKYVVDSGSAACFEYIGAQHGHARFIHCKCEKCGRILHIDRGEIEEMARLLEERSGFRIDNVQTVLYGICGECREQK